MTATAGDVVDWLPTGVEWLHEDPRCPICAGDGVLRWSRDACPLDCPPRVPVGSKAPRRKSPRKATI